MDEQVKANSEKFLAGLANIAAKNIETVQSHSSDLLTGAYASASTFQAWRSILLEDIVKGSSLGFFTEAQSDISISIILVQVGMWRPAMKSLRSSIENMIRFAYYMDHSVEFELWEGGKHRLTFQQHFSYLEDHPRLKEAASHLSPIAELEKSYRNLSNVVHASSRENRTTDDSSVIIVWKSDKASSNKWNTEFKRVASASNLLLLCLFASHLQGAKLGALRQSMAGLVSPAKNSKIKEALHVNVPKV